MKKEYDILVNEGLKRTREMGTPSLGESDIEHLPAIVRKYLSYTCPTGWNKINNLRLVCSGGIRSSEKAGWMKFRSEQYNFFDQPSRFFYIRASRSGIPAIGLHSFENSKASMVIKLAGLFTIVDARGPEMDQAETVTLFNDMCVLAPGTLTSRNISWKEVDDITVKASFTNYGITISATLYFNENGELTNFISYDRYETIDGKSFHNHPWSTPLREYKQFGKYKLASEASLIYHRPDGDFCYGEFTLKEAGYNCTE